MTFKYSELLSKFYLTKWLKLSQDRKYMVWNITNPVIFQSFDCKSPLFWTVAFLISKNVFFLIKYVSTTNTVWISVQIVQFMKNSSHAKSVSNCYLFFPTFFPNPFFQYFTTVNFFLQKIFNLINELLKYYKILMLSASVLVVFVVCMAI